MPCSLAGLTRVRPGATKDPECYARKFPSTTGHRRHAASGDQGDSSSKSSCQARRAQTGGGCSSGGPGSESNRASDCRSGCSRSSIWRGFCTSGDRPTSRECSRSRPARTCCCAPARTCCCDPARTCCCDPARTCCCGPARTCCCGPARTCCRGPARTCCRGPARTCCGSSGTAHPTLDACNSSCSFDSCSALRSKCRCSDPAPPAANTETCGWSGCSNPSAAASFKADGSSSFCNSSNVRGPARTCPTSGLYAPVCTQRTPATGCDGGCSYGCENRSPAFRRTFWPHQACDTCC